MNNTLPDDIEQLKALLIAQQAVIVRLSGEITGYAREISSLRALVAKRTRSGRVQDVPFLRKRRT
ncbi:hypothetical protein K3225_004538 [Escherichia coli]|nr:hypothetical protein [Escherichia coli]